MQHFFKVNKNTLQSYFHAYAGGVTENLGERVQQYESGPDYFDTLKEAEIFAIKWKKRALKNVLYTFAKYNKIELAIFRFRSLWNKKLRNSLNRYENRLASAKANITNFNINPVLDVKAIPDWINIEGARLTIGTSIYSVDTYNLRLQENKVLSEVISFYGNEGKATYRLENNHYITAEQAAGFPVEKNSVFYFRNPIAAKAKMKEVLQAKVAKVNQMIEDLP